MKKPELLQEIWFQHYGHIEKGTVVKVQTVEEAAKGYSHKSEDGSYTQARYFITRNTFCEVVFHPNNDNTGWESRKTIDARDAYETREKLVESIEQFKN